MRSFDRGTASCFREALHGEALYLARRHHRFRTIEDEGEKAWATTGENWVPDPPGSGRGVP